MSSVYTINKGINKPIEFKGLKAQYIWWLGGGLVILLILFAVLYISGLNNIVCLIITATLAGFLFMYVYRLSHLYGQYGMMKAFAKHKLPKVIKSYSRKPFLTLSKTIQNSPRSNTRFTKRKTPINKSIL